MGTGDGYGDRWWLWGQVVALGTGSGFGGTVALGAQWPQVVAWGGRKMAMGTGSGYGDRWWLWGQMVALGAPWWPHVVALGTPWWL